MSRTIPYYTNVIVPNSIDKGKSVLIASSENAIRGLLMYLCDIPEDKINEVHTYIHTYVQTYVQTYKAYIRIYSYTYCFQNIYIRIYIYTYIHTEKFIYSLTLTTYIHIKVEIPTGLPLVYNFEKRCIQLLDDGNVKYIYLFIHTYIHTYKNT